MNSVAMLIQQIKPSQAITKQTKPSGQEGETESFHRFFQENVDHAQMVQVETTPLSEKGLVIDDPSEWLTSEIGSEDEKTLSNIHVGNMKEDSEAFTEALDSGRFDDYFLGIQSFSIIDFVAANEKSLLTNTNSDLELNAFLTQIQTLISQLQTEEDVWKASPNVLELLHQWQQLSKDANYNQLPSGLSTVDNKEINGLKLLQLWQHLNSEQATTNSSSNGPTSLNNEDVKTLKVWNSLLETFQKREQLAGKQRYNTDANVTVTDVAKWLGQAIEKENLTVATVQPSQTVPISKLEQHVIHINPLHSTETADQQLIDRFEEIMKSNKLSLLPNQRNQLMITLRPDNMGEMMVRFTQLNGEIMVKILVTSAAAKEMLESNIHQLKNMFSPHQVVVEKQDANVGQTTNVQKEQEDGQLKEQEQQQSNQSDHKDNQQNEGSFESQFEELLMNEKV